MGSMIDENHPLKVFAAPITGKKPEPELSLWDGYWGSDGGHVAPEGQDPKCECGAASVGVNKHSSWCPMIHLEEQE